MSKYYYKSSTGKIIDFDSETIWSDPHWLREFQWDIQIDNNIFTSIIKNAYNKKVDVYFWTDSPMQTARERDEAYKIAEKDIILNQPGRLYVGDYYLECYIGGLSDPDASIRHKMIHTEMTIFATAHSWKKDVTYTFHRVVPDENMDGLGYPYDYPYDYSSRFTTQNSFDNPSAFPSKFVMTIFGPATLPGIEIGGHRYALIDSVLDGERVVIDSVNKTIIKKSNDVDINWLGKRWKEQSIFEDVPDGISTLSWDGSFGWNITVIDERSEFPLAEIEKPDQDDEDVTNGAYLTSSGDAYMLSDGSFYIVRSA